MTKYLDRKKTKDKRDTGQQMRNNKNRSRENKTPSRGINTQNKPETYGTKHMGEGEATDNRQVRQITRSQSRRGDKDQNNNKSTWLT